jgi:hypothetical protein
MKRVWFALIAVTWMAFWTVQGTLTAQDFQKNYGIPAGGQIRIGNVSGDIKVTGSKNIGTVTVSAYKVGRDRDLVKVEDTGTGDRIDLKVVYPEHGNCDAGVNFEVHVPQGIEYNFERLTSVSGNVEITSVRGRLRAESVSGNVVVKDVAGIVSANSVSGDVDVEITRLEGSGEMKFSSVSGNVAVRAPASLDADIEMSSLSGSLKTDFPIEIQERRYGPGRSARGRLGGGANNLRITSVSGRVSLTRI